MPQGVRKLGRVASQAFPLVPEPAADDAAIRGLELYGDETPAKPDRGHGRAAGSGERVEHDLSRPREGPDQRLKYRWRLLGRVPPVPAVAPGEHVSDRPRRWARVAFREQEGRLVAVLEETPARQAAMTVSTCGQP